MSPASGGDYHRSDWTEDDGFITVECTKRDCPWEIVVPDAETAGDAWGDHMYDVGVADGWDRAKADSAESVAGG